MDAFIDRTYHNEIVSSFEKDSVPYILQVFGGECCMEDVIEANTYLSGIGFESGGLSGAHSIHNGMTVLEETHKLLHGEKVAYGALTQLMLENRPEGEVESIARFCKKVGLPTTLKDLGLADVTDDRLLEAAKETCKPDDTMVNMPFEVSPEMIIEAMRKVDALGKRVAISDNTPICP